jgi:hypothetical protein
LSRSCDSWVNQVTWVSVISSCSLCCRFCGLHWCSLRRVFGLAAGRVHRVYGLPPRSSGPTPPRAGEGSSRSEVPHPLGAYPLARRAWPLKQQYTVPTGTVQTNRIPPPAARRAQFSQLGAIACRSSARSGRAQVGGHIGAAAVHIAHHCWLIGFHDRRHLDGGRLCRRNQHLTPARLAAVFRADPHDAVHRT